MTIYILLQIIAAIAETVIGIDLIFPYMKPLYKRTVTAISFFLFLFIHNFFFLVLIGKIPTAALMTEVVLFYFTFAVFIKKFFEGPLLYNYCSVFGYRFAIRLIGTLITLIPVILLNEYEAAAKTGGGTDGGNIIGRIVMWISYPCVYFLGRKIFRWYNSKERRGRNTLAILFAVADFFTTLWIGIRSLSLLPILLIIIVVVVYMIQEADEAEIRENFSYYNELQEKTQAQEMKLSVIRHDLANHLSALAVMDEEMDSVKLMENLNRSRHKWTGIPILDCLLSEKKRLAERKGIKLNIDSIAFTADEKQQVNLVTILSNIIDNGVEACERALKEGEQEKTSCSCDFSMSSRGEYICITMENDKSPGEKPIKIGFRTSKADNKNHGYGHRILRHVVNAMDGQIFYEDKGERFVTRVLVKI